ncbi:transmembrane amino acid transporter protein-domain-containing protein [Talaromyces proteolyticus]|uniref:Transmembrane amino acid transporter protein-domain-containing protein n=1 Tax=Talaromyces proteolyticus TaxID=1131652 RepID=A0AAD4KPH1_9EURO|nr:transmembrane amino acid transporter protein-domain-containing protein [Talaromyces proteolyticus]KAH8695333.1 transmembrane amino acid transporter protein-domain-containing protein [Talaromyces proteolyticus]
MAEKSKAGKHEEGPVGHLDRKVSLLEYIQYAMITRAEEEARMGSELSSFETSRFGFLSLLYPKGSDAILRDIVGQSVQQPTTYVSDMEWANASRALRNATWGAVFFLITTDMFGPLTVPWAISQLGYVPGVVLYTVFGAVGGYTTHQLWTIFILLDSSRYPLKTYGEMAYRIYGPWARGVCNVLQSLQLFFSVGLLILSNGQGISQLSFGRLCFVVCNLVFTIAGCLVGQVRSIQRFQWLANIAIWLNIAILCITMGAVANSAPNYEAAAAQSLVQPGPVVTSVDVPEGSIFQGQIIGLLQAIYAYGGAMIYCEIMNEMKRPWDFWKSFILAQTFIFCFYMFYGLFVYSYQGQFTVLLSNQGISIDSLRTASNSLGIVSSLILACLYGNIGIKVFYKYIGVEWLHFPDLNTTQTGKILFAGLVPVYWSLAFVICSAIPNLTNFSALIAAVCVLQFTFTFPPILMVGLSVQREAETLQQPFNPQAENAAPPAPLKLEHLVKAYKKHWIMNTINILFFLASLSLAGLGIYSSIYLLQITFATNDNITSFTCVSPVG